MATTKARVRAERSAPASSPAPTPATVGRGVSPFVKALVAFHVLAITVWSLPKPKPEVLAGRAKPYGSDHLLLFNDRTMRALPPIAGYLQTTGAWQYWDMFAPDPARVDVYGDAEIEMRDGTRRLASYPRMYRLNLFDRYLKERYRKFYERAGDGQNVYLWPIFARVLAREVAGDPANPPVAVTLRRHALPVAPPGERQTTVYTDETYFRYIVLPEDLKGGPP